ncbi:hypothetical protein SteCoe_15329 [Stentor coeruleus]|uniref:RING-type domain-containing protein n=1 Tax=Stentor coeruleus TaxID=5963 RepID=A0A1R2C414_9CILI|nr:hypothetical protein SteCoe_15329 [Stentor coeruleus]
MDCEQLCMSCSFTQLFKVNYAYYHGLCEDHKNLKESTLKCIYCQSIIPILFLSEIKPCTNCFMHSQRVFKNCSHNACENCYQNECSKCSNLCNFCLKSVGIKFKSCSHLLCNDCLLDSKLVCSLCEFLNDDFEDFCEYCNVYCNDIIDKECGRKICKKCSGDLNQCQLCMDLCVSIDEIKIHDKDLILEPQKIKNLEFLKSAEGKYCDNEGKIGHKIKNDVIQIEGFEKDKLNFEDANENLENACLIDRDSETLICNAKTLDLNNSPDSLTRKKIKSKACALRKVDDESLQLTPKGEDKEKSFIGKNPVSTEIDDILLENKIEEEHKSNQISIENQAPQIQNPTSKFFFFISCCLCCGLCKAKPHN